MFMYYVLPSSMPNHKSAFLGYLGYFRKLSMFVCGHSCSISVHFFRILAASIQ